MLVHFKHGLFRGALLFSSLSTSFQLSFQLPKDTMNHFFTCWTVNTLVFIAVILFAVVSCSNIACNLKKQYPLIDKTTGATLDCIYCRSCKPGFETYPPCGTTISPYDVVGICHMCKDNYTYSAHEDLLPCQPCRRSKCDNNEIPGGTCKHAEPDHSYCTRRATTVVDKPTVRPNQTTVRLDQTTIHLDKPTALSAKSAGLSGITIFGIVFAAVFIVCVCIYLCWHFKCKKGAPTRSRADANSREEGPTPVDGTGMALLDGNRRGGTITNSAQSAVEREDRQQSGPICPETTDGSECSLVDNNDGTLNSVKDEKNTTSTPKQETCQIQNGLQTLNKPIGPETMSGYESSQNDVHLDP